MVGGQLPRRALARQPHPEAPISLLDVDVARSHFPAFAEPSLAGWVHAENAGGSWPCRQVLGRLERYYAHTKLQAYPHYPAGAAAAEAMAQTAPALARWLGVPEDDVHIGPSTTANTYVLANAFRQILGPGDAVVVTEQDHEANSGVWRRLADGGVDVREWRVDPSSGSLATDGLDALLDDRVAVVAFPHASNVVGEPNDVAAITERARAVGAITVVDGVAAAPHGLPDVGALGADVYLFSAYKTWGPHQGVMTVRRDLLDRLPNEGHFFNADQATKRLNPAGPDHAQVAALAGVPAYLDALADDLGGGPDEVLTAIHAREVAVLAPILDVLRDRPGVRLIGPDRADARVPTVSVVLERPGAQVAADLAQHRIMCAGGHFYAYRLVEALGIDPTHGVLRLSLLHYTSDAEVAQVCEALDAVL